MLLSGKGYQFRDHLSQYGVERTPDEIRQIMLDYWGKVLENSACKVCGTIGETLDGQCTNCYDGNDPVIQELLSWHRSREDGGDSSNIG